MYALLYSESQQCFHIETVDSMLNKNLHIYLKGKSCDYFTLAIGSTIEEMQAVKRQLVAKRAETPDPRYLLSPDE